MLQKLLRQNISIPQLAGYAFAALTGMSIIFAAFCFSRDIRPLFEPAAGLFNPEYMVVNKKVTFGSLFNNRLTIFSEDEIEEIRQQRFVKSLTYFTPARFRIQARTIPSSQIPAFYTDLFFESVSDKLIGIDPKDWQWDPAVGEIPIIIPRDYLNLYNFGFAGSQGLPQISEALVQQITFRVFLMGNNRREEYIGSIAGFSDDLNTILVPEDFMYWANERFGEGDDDISRLIVETYNPADPAIAEFFARKDEYDVNNNDNRGKLSYFLSLLIKIVMTVGVLIMLPAIGLMLLSINLLVYKNQETLGNLVLLGYRRSSLALPYCLLVLFLNLAVGIASLLIAAYAQSIYGQQLVTVGITELSTGFWSTTAFAMVFVMIVTALNVLWIRNKINNIKVPVMG